MALGRLGGLLSGRSSQPTASRRTGAPLYAIKLRAMEAAAEQIGARSFADLGGVWVVEGGYTFHALGISGITAGTLVDTGLSDIVRERAKEFPHLRLVDGNFGDAETARRVGDVDMVLLYDVLLHQVAPDWDEVVRLYAGQTRAFVIVQPQWTGPKTVRLLDLGREEYLANVPPEQIDIDFDKLGEIHPKYNRPIRDIHEIWQWGITDRDLIDAVTAHGFRLTYWEHGGQWRTLERFVNIAYVFVRD